MIIRCSLDNGKDKVLSRSSDDNVEVVISVEVEPRRYEEYTLSLINLDNVAVGIYFWQDDDWDSKTEVAIIHLGEPE